MKEKLFFGTDGLRGHAESFPFTSAPLIALGRSLAEWAHKKYHIQKSLFIIAHDTRSSCSTILQSLAHGLRAHNATYFYAGVLPTPALQIVLKHHSEIHGAIMISASHNPAHDNGIKLFSREGKFSLRDEQTIIDHFNHFYSLSADTPPPLHHDHDIQTESKTLYLSHLHSHIRPFTIPSKKIVIDCAHGATFELAEKVFAITHAEIIVCNNKPNGKNINSECGSLAPSFIQKKVREEKADIGFAFDGDGDRIIAVTKEGVIKDGDDVLALLATNPSFAATPTIVGTVMANYGFENHLKALGKNLVRTPVGDKYIAAYLAENNLPLGGENSGHIIIQSYLSGGDGLFIALKILETVELTHNWELKTFEKYPQCLINIPTARKDNLENHRYASVIKRYAQALPEGRLLVRFSGTENMLRVMSEDKNKEHARSIAQALAHDLKNLLE